MTFGENLSFQENLNFLGKSLNQFRRPFISPEKRIPVKCDFQGKFELLGKREFPGNVSLADNGLARYITQLLAILATSPQVH